MYRDAYLFFYIYKSKGSCAPIIKTRNPLTIISRITEKGRKRDGRKEACIYTYCASVLYMQTVNPALYPEGALRCSAIVNFARGEKYRGRFYKNRERSGLGRAPVELSGGRAGRKREWLGRTRGKLEWKCEKGKECSEKEKERDLPIAPLTYFTLILPLYSIRQVAIAARIASSCLDVERVVHV